MPTATEVVLPSRVARPLPRVALPPGALRGAPSTTADAAARAVIDGKLNAALREAILQEINSDAKVVEAFIDGLALDYRAHLDLRVPALVQRVVVPAMRARPTSSVRQPWRTESVPAVRAACKAVGSKERPESG